MNLIDIFAVIILVFFALRGWRRGFLRGILGLAGIAIALFVAVTYGGQGANLILGLATVPPQTAALLSFLAIFVAVLIILHLAGQMSYRLVHLSPATVVDATGGMALGLLKGAVLLSIALTLASALSLPKSVSDEVGKSTLTESMRKMGSLLFDRMKRTLPESKDFLSLIESRRDRTSSLHTDAIEDLTEKIEKGKTKLDSLVRRSEKTVAEKSLEKTK